MIKPTLEYIGFRTTAARREYFLRCRSGEDIHEYTVGIAQAAFSAGRARFQDGPEICYAKLQRELDNCGGQAVAPDLTVSDAELAGYRESHTVPARRRSFSDAATAPARPKEGNGEASRPGRLD